jgi:tetratricopeptide (TPR) repeat protein
VNKVPSFGAVALLVSAAPLYPQAMGQNTGPESGAASGTAAVANITGTRSPWGTPATTNANNGISDPSRSMFISGNVMFDDGASPDSRVRIERVCAGSVRLETHADSKGRFSFEAGGEVASSIADADSSNNNFGTARSATDGASESESLGASGLQHCQLRAAYPGYVSDSIDLSASLWSHQRVGTIILHRLRNVRGTTISATTALAPKSAQKSFAKGYQLTKKGKFPEAELKFRAATSEYPKFAAAWFALGQVQRRLNEPQNAEKSYLAAIAADARFVSPYNQLSLLSGEQGRWQDAAKYSQEAIELNPVELPSSYWFNALANYNLRNDTAAEKSAQALVSLDSRHAFPQAEVMLGEFAENRGNLTEAEAHLRAFLSAAPAAPNTAEIKRKLARIEAEVATQAKRMPVVLH